MSSNAYYALQVIRIEDIPQRVNSAPLDVEIELNNVKQKPITLDSEGNPQQHSTLTFARSANDVDTLSIRIRQSDVLVGHAQIDAEALSKELGGEDIRQELYIHSQGMSFWKRLWKRLCKSKKKRLEKAGIIILHLRPIDDQTRAGIEVTAAEQSIKHIETLIERTERREEAIGAFMNVADGIIAVVDNIAEIHPVFNVSWKAVTALYKLLHYQLQKDAELLGMVKDMQTAFGFCKEARKLNDSTETLRPIVKTLLEETAKCSRFVQDYAKRSFTERASDTTSMERIKSYAEEFTKLRGNLDTAIVLNTNKEVHDMNIRQRLEELEKMLQPRKSDLSSMTIRSRCLEGTRQDYLDPIIKFLFYDKHPNVFWLTGAAGSGKSTIAVTTSDMCGSKGSSPAYVFFEREKSDPSSVIRTIAYTLAESHPSLGRSIYEALRADKNTPGTTIRDQFERLLLVPLGAFVTYMAGPVIIVLDALDECGTAAQRADLLELLATDFARLPPKVRVLVTSRPEGDVTGRVSGNDGIQHVELRHDSDRSRRDVDRYIYQEMADALGRPRPEEGVRDVQMETLCKAADGLFIWAATAVKMVQNEVFKEKMLKSLVEDVQLVGGSGLDRLYDTALKESRLWEPRSRDESSAVMGLILFAKDALDISSISAFLGLEVSMVEAILSRLGSVVSYEPGKPIRLHHASFADYLLSPQRSGEKPWHVDETEPKQNMTERCFDIMATNLRFNICRIESSFIPNSEVPGLRERIDKNIPPHLNYACRFWSSHMCELENPEALTVIRSKLRDFANDRLLYWLEALSLTDYFVRIAGRALNDAISWIKSADPEISSFLWSAYKLASVFAYAISQSAPHVYLSAIPLSSDESPVSQHYSKTCPVVKVHRQGKTPAQCMRVLEGRGVWVESVAISSDGRRVASSSGDKVIRDWDIDSGELSPSSLGMDEPGVIAFSWDDKYIVSCSKKGTVYAWDVDNGKDVSHLKLADVDGAASRAACAPDGKRVVCVCEGKVYILDFDNGNLELVPDWFEDVEDVEFRAVSLSGKYVVGTENRKIGVWDTDLRERVSDWFGEDKSPYAASCDGNRVVSGDKIWNVDNGDLVAVIREIAVEAASFSSDGKRVVVGSRIGKIAICDVESQQVIWGPVLGHTNWVTSVIFTPDGKRVISGSFDDTVRVWDADNREPDSGSSDAHTSSVFSVAFSPDGKRVVSGSWDKTVRVWDPEAGRLLSGPFKHDDYVHSAAFSPDNKRVVSGSSDRTICIWDVEGGNQVLSLRGHEGYVYSVAYSSDGKRIASGSSDNTICIWDAVSGELVKGPLKAHTGWVISVSFSPDNKRVASGSRDNTICVLDVDSGDLVKGPLEGHSAFVRSVTFSPDGQRIASGSEDGTIRIWDADTGELVLPPFKGHSSGVLSVTYSPDGKRIASGSWDTTVCIWDVESGKLALDPLEGHTGQVISVSFSPDGERVVSGSDDKTIRVWDVSDDSVAPLCNERHAEGDVAGSSPHNAAATSRVQGVGLDPRRARSISNWKLHDDGWIRGEGGELLAWIPQDMRTTLWTRRTKMIFSCDFVTKLDFLNSPVGENWAEGYPKQS